MDIHHHPINADAVFLEQPQQLLPSRIITDHPHDIDGHAQVDQHSGHPGCPPEGRLAPLHTKHRRRRVGTDPISTTKTRFIKHQVADHQNRIGISFGHWTVILLQHRQDPFPQGGLARGNLKRHTRNPHGDGPSLQAVTEPSRIFRRQHQGIGL